MTTREWFEKHLSSMFPKHEKHVVHGALYGEYGNPCSFSNEVTGHRDHIDKDAVLFNYTLHDTLVFKAVKNFLPQCVESMRVMYRFYPCWCSKLTQDRLNMIAEILHVPVKFHMDDGNDCELYADGLLCSSVEIYPGCRKVIYNVTPIYGEPYMIVRGYDKKGVRWV